MGKLRIRRLEATRVNTTSNELSILSFHSHSSRSPLQFRASHDHRAFPTLRRMPRHDGRKSDQLRPISFTPNIAPHSTGSVLVAAGNTRVICSAMIEESIPNWMKFQ